MLASFFCPGVYNIIEYYQLSEQESYGFYWGFKLFELNPQVFRYGLYMYYCMYSSSYDY